MFLAPYAYNYGYPSYYDSGYYSDALYYPAAVVVDTAAVNTTLDEQSGQDSLNSDVGNQYLASARETFRAGEYHASLRLVRHAAVEMPRSAEIHQFTSLALFAIGDYRTAAVAAQVALSVGKPWDWPAVRGNYAAAEDYTSQLRALENYLDRNPTAAYATFLLGYQYLMLGHSKAAEQQFKKTVELNPKDKLAAKLLKTLRSAAGPAVAPIPGSRERKSPETKS